MLCDPFTHSPRRLDVCVREFVRDGIGINILRTSKQVHREAYDVMVKTNQLIRIETQAMHMGLLFHFHRLLVVTMDPNRVAQFKGYVLTVHMEAVTVY
ncbi:hypothetical protein BDV95DRAFT_575453, partial [Massariosphaeria phaeospora]